MEMVCLKPGIRKDRFDRFGEALGVIREGRGHLEPEVFELLQKLPDSLPTPCPARRQVWGGSRRRAIAHRRLDAQSANPHVRRLSVCACTPQPLNSGECVAWFLERLSSVETATLLWAFNIFENWDLCSPENRAASSRECFVVTTIKNKR